MKDMSKDLTSVLFPDQDLGFQRSIESDNSIASRPDENSDEEPAASTRKKHLVPKLKLNQVMLQFNEDKTKDPNIIYAAGTNTAYLKT